MVFWRILILLPVELVPCSRMKNELFIIFGGSCENIFNIWTTSQHDIYQKLARMEGAEETPSTSTEKRNSISNLMPRVARYLSYIRFLMIRVARHMKCFLLLFIYCENTCEYNAFSGDLKILTFQGLGGGLCPLYCLLGWVFQLLCFHFYAASPELLTAIYYYIPLPASQAWSSNVKPVSVVQTDLDKVLPMEGGGDSGGDWGH